jgi:hypothetical protein
VFMLLWRHSQALLKHLLGTFAASLKNVSGIFKKICFLWQISNIFKV